MGLIISGAFTAVFILLVVSVVRIVLLAAWGRRPK